MPLPSFHMKRTNYEMNKELLFSNTEFSEDRVQDIFNVYPTE
jgi:hypothetical protein